MTKGCLGGKCGRGGLNIRNKRNWNTMTCNFRANVKVACNNKFAVCYVYSKKNLPTKHEQQEKGYFHG